MDLHGSFAHPSSRHERLHVAVFQMGGDCRYSTNSVNMALKVLTKYDAEIANCTDYYSRQCAAMEASRGQNAASKHAAANSRALILASQVAISKCEVGTPTRKLWPMRPTNVCCDKDMAETEAKQSERESAMLKLSIQIDSINAKSAKLKDKVAVLQKELAAVSGAGAQAEMDKLKAEEKGAFNKNSEEIEKGINDKDALKLFKKGPASAVRMGNEWSPSDAVAVSTSTSPAMATGHVSSPVRLKSCR